MPYKLCNRCSEVSYSASNHGVWECPTCGKDITKEPYSLVNPQELKPKLKFLSEEYKLHKHSINEYRPHCPICDGGAKPGYFYPKCVKP